MTAITEPVRRPIGVAPGARPSTAPTAGARRVPDPSALARKPWTVEIAGITLLVRGARAADLPAVAALHRRCSPAALLDRFRCGGSVPSVTALQAVLTRPSTVVVVAGDGRIVAWGAAEPSLSRPAPARARTLPDTRAEIGVLVEDSWQGLGLGRTLVRHLAAAAALNGIRELVTPASTAAGVSARLLGDLGTVKRIEIGGESCLRVLLPESAALGLGALQQLGGRQAARPAATG